jgi:aspartyl aminopeptidase
LKSFLDLVARENNCRVEDIVDFELSLIDAQPSCVMGLHNEFISSPRLDNLMSSITSLDAIIHYGQTDKRTGIAMVALFDHEEVGSTSAQGAASNLLTEQTQRIFYSLSPKATVEDYYLACRNSMILSADMAHATNPNYPEKHQAQHQIRM